MKASVTRRQYYSSEVNTSVTVYAEPGYSDISLGGHISFFNYKLRSALLNTLDTTFFTQCNGIGVMAHTTAHQNNLNTTTAAGIGRTGFLVGVQTQDGVTTSATGGMVPTDFAVGSFFSLGSSGGGIGNSNTFRTTSCRFIEGGLVNVLVNNTGNPTEAVVDSVNIFMSGAGVTSALIKQQIGTAATGTTCRVTCGFTPDIIFAIGSRYAGSSGQGIATGFAMRTPGAGITSIQAQGSVARTEDTGSANMYQLNRVKDNRILAFAPTQSTFPVGQVELEVLQMTANGFVYAVRNVSVSAGQRFAFLCIKTDKRYYGSIFSTSTVTGAASINLGFTPCVVFGAVTGASLTTGTNYSARNEESNSWTFFAGTGGTNYSKNKYGVGTITTTSGSLVTTGTGTSFRSRMSEGDRIYDTSNTFIGTIAAINSNTNLTLTANAAAVVTNSNFYYTSPAQFSVVFGNEFGNTASQQYNGIFDQSLIIFTSTAATQSQLVTAAITAPTFNREPEILYNYSTATATGRWGYVIAFEGDNNGRRRGGSSDG
jgi:hypothetical protein